MIRDESTGRFVRQAVDSRFWAKVDKSGSCWLWLAGKDQLGYGMFWIDGHTVHAHRVAWMLRHGLVPNGVLVCHECDEPGCVNPSHLFLGTQADNMADREAKGRGRYPDPPVNRGESHGNAKLTVAKVRRAKRLYQSEERRYGDMARLAKEYGVSLSTVYNAVKGRTWSHVA